MAIDYSKTKDIIESGGLLSDKDLAFVNESIGDIQANWNKKQVFRTETEMRISVLNDIKHPTKAAKYWQCIREQGVFYEQLVILSFEYRRNAIEQKRIIANLESLGAKKDIHSLSDEDVYKYQSQQIDLEEKQFAQVNMELQANDRMREIRLWTQIMEELDDGSFNTEDVNEHQLVSYGLRFERQIQTMGNSASPSERANLIGQDITAKRHLAEKGLLKQEQKKVDYNAIHKGH